MTIKGYTLQDAEKITNDVTNMAMFINSGACDDNDQIHSDVLEAMFVKLETLQGVLSFMRIHPEGSGIAEND
jgi:hypothetical protein